MKNIDKNKILVWLLGMLLFAVSCWVITIDYNKGCIDYVWHLCSAKEISISNFAEYYTKSTYPLWHILAKIGTCILPLSDGLVVGIVTTLFTVPGYICVNRWLMRECKSVNKTLLVSFLSFFMFVLGPLYVPQFNSYYYLGQGTPNTWHNPTNLAVRPMAIIAFVIIIKILCDYRESMQYQKRDLLILGIVLIVSVFAKPSFILMLIPGLGLYMVITFFRDRSLFKLYLHIILAFVPAVLVLLLQYIIIFASGQRGDSVGLGWLTVWNFYTPNVIVSFLLVFAFPIYVFIVDRKESWRDISVQVSICCLISGWLEASLLIEDGDHLASGNFLWGYYLAMFFVWMVALKRFVLLHKTRTKLLSIAWILLVLHIGCGMFYMYQLLFVPGIVA